mgnify:FL=1
MSAPIAVFPGTFDPITIGHVSIVQRALPLFNKVVIGVGVNSTKRTLFSEEQRLAWARAAFAGEAKVDVVSFSGLTVDLCKRLGAEYIIRGLRNSTDHGYERSIALMNRQLAGVETIFLPSALEHGDIHNTLRLQGLPNSADVSALVPEGVRPIRP